MMLLSVIYRCIYFEVKRDHQELLEDEAYTVQGKPVATFQGKFNGKHINNLIAFKLCCPVLLVISTKSC